MLSASISFSSEAVLSIIFFDAWSCISVPNHPGCLIRNDADTVSFPEWTASNDSLGVKRFTWIETIHYFVVLYYHTYHTTSPTGQRCDCCGFGFSWSLHQHVILCGFNLGLLNFVNCCQDQSSTYLVFIAR